MPQGLRGGGGGRGMGLFGIDWYIIHTRLTSLLGVNGMENGLNRGICG